VGQLGTSSRKALMMELENINTMDGLADRPIEMVICDSEGQPQKATRIAWINGDGREILIDAGSSSGAFAPSASVSIFGNRLSRHGCDSISGTLMSIHFVSLRH